MFELQKHALKVAQELLSSYESHHKAGSMAQANEANREYRAFIDDALIPLMLILTGKNPSGLRYPNDPGGYYDSKRSEAKFWAGLISNPYFIDFKKDISRRLEQARYVGD